MKVKTLEKGLTYRGKVEAIRQTYYVFEGPEYFFVLSFSKSKKNSGNFNVVDTKAAEYVRSRFAGKKAVTANGVYDAARRTRHFATPLAALNALYVLAGSGEARIDSRKSARQLFFNLRPRRA